MPTTQPNQIVGRNIRMLREKLGLTQEALAQYLNISRELISYYETGSRTITTEQLGKLANLFFLDEYEFYEENLQQAQANMAFAFRADTLSAHDLESVARFKKVVRNYLNMLKAEAE